MVKQFLFWGKTRLLQLLQLKQEVSFAVTCNYTANSSYFFHKKGPFSNQKYSQLQST